MHRTIVIRRPDGIPQIARRAAWPVSLGAMPWRVLASVVLVIGATASLAVMLVVAPKLVLVAGVAGIGGFAAARWARRPAPAADGAPPRGQPQLDAVHPR